MFFGFAGLEFICIYSEDFDREGVYNNNHNNNM